MKIAALDLGTNTFLMLIAEVSAGRIEKIFRDEMTVTRLGQGVHQNRAFHPEALARAEECFKNYQKIRDQEKVDRVIALATSAARDVKNGAEFLALGEKYGFPITIIEGQKEAELTFLGATFDLPESSDRAVVDVGGGSTEIIGRGADGQIEGFSFDVGSVRLTEMFLTRDPAAPSELAKLENHVREVFKDGQKLLPQSAVAELIAVAGTPTTLAAVVQNQAYSDSLVHGYRLKKDVMKSWLSRLAVMPLKEREKLPGMDAKRADVINAGLIILLAAMEALKVSVITVSVRGVRFGAALMAEREEW